jgi:hypothetical protein
VKSEIHSSCMKCGEDCLCSCENVSLSTMGMLHGVT